MKHLLGAATLVVVAQFGLGQALACEATIPTVEKGKLTVAAYDYPPFSITGPGSEISGIDADIVKRAAKENCLEVVAQIMDPAATIQAVISGKADVAIGSWNRTEKRAEVLDISAPTYLDPMGVFSKEGFDSIEALKGKQVGTVTGYLWVGELQQLFGADLKLYPTPIALAQDLDAGRIDAGLDGYNSGVFLQKTADGYKGIQIVLAKPDERVQASVQPAQAGVLYTKGNAALGKALDASIVQQHADGTIVKALEANGFDAKVGDVGEPRMVK
jgi:polar amino acid transport system substrate-binding protein